MIQDIGPRVFSNNFKPRPPRQGDYVIIYGNEKVYMCAGEDGIETTTEPQPTGATTATSAPPAPVVPEYARLGEIAPDCARDPIYLFCVDDVAFFYADACKLTGAATGLFTEMPSGSFRSYGSKWLAFAGITACHLAGWYERHRICGKCGANTKQSVKERMIECPECGAMYYPRISPAVIVGVTDGPRLLLTRYANRPGVNYALIAGFCEIGETVEDTVRREVMEEVGLRVKNIRFYKSQPWGFSSSLLMGFYCDLDGSGEVTLDREELSVAEWFDRGDIAVTDTSISLTSEMIETFRTQR